MRSEDNVSLLHRSLPGRESADSVCRGVSVSVCMLTFNHEKYIARAIESVINQQANFPLELVIGDDMSADRTQEICEFYQRNYPGIIFYTRNKVNLGMNDNFLQTYGRCKGKYIAMLEGDDEWTDPMKLAKQVSILENDPSIAMVYSNALIHDTQNPLSNIYFNERNRPRQVSGKHEVLSHCTVPTCTVVFRNKIINIPNWFTKTKASGYFLFYLLTQHGPLYYHDEAVALYNHHYNGLSRLTSVKHMLLGDSLFLYKLVEEYYQDDESFKIAFQKNVQAMNDLFHLGAFKYALKLYWKQPFYRILKSNIANLFLLGKLFFKFHLLWFLSRKEAKGVY